jgi:hypothetical protein
MYSMSLYLLLSFPPGMTLNIEFTILSKIAYLNPI